MAAQRQHGGAAGPVMWPAVWAGVLLCAASLPGEVVVRGEAKMIINANGNVQVIKGAPGVVNVIAAPGAAAGTGGSTLVSIDADFQRALANAQRYIERGEFDSAAELLQTLLSRPDAGFAATEERGRFGAMTTRVNEALASMGEAGLARYRMLYDSKAAALLRQAADQGDAKLLRQVATEYLHTRSGAAALDALGDQRFDQGRFEAAGRYWQQAAAAGDEAMRPCRLAKRVVALHLAGRAEEARALGDEVARRYPGAMATLGGRVWKLPEFLAWSAALAPATAEARTPSPQGEWLGTGAGGPMAGMSDCTIVPSPQWQVSGPPAAPGVVGETVPLMAMRPWMQRPTGGSYYLRASRKGGHVVVRWQARDGRDLNGYGPALMQDLPLVAAVDPVVVGDLVICRQDDAVAAYDLTGARTGAGGQMVWKSLPLPVAGAGNWIASPYAWFADASAFSMTSDGRRAYVVGALPGTAAPAAPATPETRRVGMGLRIIGSGVALEAEPSALVALSLEAEGKVLWAVGGGAGDGGDETLRWARFPSAPAVQGGRLYAGAVLNDTFHLVCLDAAGTALWKAPIADSAQGNATMRRYRPPAGPAGVSIALADGMVYMCTNTGVLACVDAESGQALWARQYVSSETLLNRSRGGSVNRPGGLGGNLNPLLVLDGKVICLPGDQQMDRSDVLAVSAADGRLLWSKPSQGQTELSALDSRRVLLSSPGLVVLDAANGADLFAQKDLGLRGRPAVGPKAVLAGGQGQLVRMDLKGYAITRTNLASPEAMLGNLVAVGGRLVAANASGLCLYVNYDDHRADLDRRLAQAPAPAKPAVLLERGKLSCQAGRFADALADLAAVREQTGPAGPLADAAAEWLMRTYVAQGDRRQQPGEMIQDYRLAYDAAGTPARRAQMLVRLAKACRQEAAQFPAAPDGRKLQSLRRAVEAAHQLAESFAGEKVADVPIGAAAVAQAPDTPELTGARAWAMEVFVPAVLKESGRECYAPWDAQADQALAAALAADDVPAILAVRDRWPNSSHVPRALIAAAESIYRRQTAAPAPDEGEMERAYGLLADAEDRSDPRSAVTSLAGRALISARRSGASPLAWILVQQIRDVCTGANIPLTEPVGFNRSDKPLKSMLDELGSAGGVHSQAPSAPAPEASLPAPVEPAFSLKGDLYLVRDQAWGALRQGACVLAIQDDKLLWLDTAAPSADKAPRWKATVPMNSRELRDYMPGAPGFTMVAALAPDGKSALVASRTWAVAVNLADGSPRWKSPVNIAALAGGSVQSMGVGGDRLLIQDHRGRVTCLDADGKVAWTTDLSRDLGRFEAPPQIAGGLAMVYGTGCQKVACLDLRTGKVRGLWSGKQPVSARVLPCGLAAVMADGACSLYSMAGSSPAARAIWTRKYNAAMQPAIVGADRDRLFVSDSIARSTFEAIRLDNKPVYTVTLSGRGRAGAICSVQPAGGFLYVSVGRNIQGQRHSLYMGQTVIQPLSIHKVNAATGQEAWKDVTPLATVPTTASFPITPAGATVVTTVGGPAFGYAMSVILLGAADGRPVQTIELSGPAAQRQGADANFARRRSIGAALAIEGRLAVEDIGGLTVYRPKGAAAPAKP